MTIVVVKMKETDFYRYIEKKLELKKNSLNKDTLLKNIEDWDSLAILTFIVVMESDFSKKIDNKNISKARKGSDLYKLLELK